MEVSGFFTPTGSDSDGYPYEPQRVTYTSPDDGQDTMRIFHGGWTNRGAQVGEVIKGRNGEWYFVSMARAGWAYPLDSLDNIQGTGWATPERAVMSGLDLRPGTIQ